MTATRRNEKALMLDTSVCRGYGSSSGAVIRRSSTHIQVRRCIRKDDSVVDRRALDELLALYRLVLDAVKSDTPVVQLMGVEGGVGAFTTAALLASVVVDLEQCGVLLLSDREFEDSAGITLPPLRVMHETEDSVCGEGEDGQPGHFAPDGGSGLFVCSIRAWTQAAELSKESPPDLAASVQSLVNLMKPLFRMVLIDLGPAVGSFDALRACRNADGIILVVEADRTTALDAKGAIKRIIGAGGRPLAVVLNRQKPLLPPFLARLGTE